MESIAFFEKKVSLSPKNLNKVGKDKTIDGILLEKLREKLENKCSEHGFVVPGSLKLLSRSMGYFESGRFTGDAVYFIKAEGKVYYPTDGTVIVGNVIRKNKMGLYVDYKKALKIQVPRDLHLGNEDFDNVEPGDTVEVELKKSLFQVNDPFILVNGIFLKKVVNEQGAETTAAAESTAVAATSTAAQKTNETIDKGEGKTGDEDEDEDEEEDEAEAEAEAEGGEEEEEEEEGKEEESESESEAKESEVD